LLFDWWTTESAKQVGRYLGKFTKHSDLEKNKKKKKGLRQTDLSLKDSFNFNYYNKLITMKVLLYKSDEFIYA